MDIISLYNFKFQLFVLGLEFVFWIFEGSLVYGFGFFKDSFGELSWVIIWLLEELDWEWCFLLNEIEKEEKEKFWYYLQLQGLFKCLDELLYVEMFLMQMDLIWQ